jgi:hypothetical protein
MPPKLYFIHQLFFHTLLGFWLLMGICSPGRKEERGLCDTGRGKEGPVTRSSERIDSIKGGGNLIHFLTSLT